MRAKLCRAALRVAAVIGLVAALAAVVLLVVCAVGVYIWLVRLGVEHFGGDPKDAILYSAVIPITVLGLLWIGQLMWACSEPFYQDLVDRFCKEKSSDA